MTLTIVISLVSDKDTLTQQAITTLINKITSCLDCGDLVMIFLDLKNI